MSDIAMTNADPLRRVAKTERIVALDVLRGFAILAILMMNIPYMGGYANFDYFDPRIPTWTAADQLCPSSEDWLKAIESHWNAPVCKNEKRASIQTT